jgi:hypothetical protein
VGIDGRIISEFILRIWDANKPYTHFITGNFSVIQYFQQHTENPALAVLKHFVFGTPETDSCLHLTRKK